MSDFATKFPEFQVKLQALLDEYKFSMYSEVIFTDKLGNQHVVPDGTFISRVRVAEVEQPVPEDKPKKNAGK